MKNKRIILLLLAVVMMFFSGCSDVSLGSDSLLRPPRATGDKAEIQDIITQQAGGSYTFKYPQNGANRSAITMRNENVVNEFALALYSNDNDSKLNVSIISYIDNKWQCIGTFSNSGTGVDRVLFEDLNGDGTDEVIIGWTSYNNTQKTLSAYSVSDTAYEIAIDDTYDEIAVADLTEDSIDDIVLLSLGTQKNPSSAKLLQYSEQEKKPIGKYAVELDSDITNFANIVTGSIAQNQTGIVIDGEKSGGVLTTQIIYFDKEKNMLVNPMIAKLENGTYSNPTTRKDTIYSRDADNDSIIEVPVVTPMSASSDENASNVCSLTSWKQYSLYNKAIGTKLNTVINYNDRYYFTMPNRWVNGAVTAIADPDTRQMTFYIWNSKTSSLGDKLLTIYRYTSEEWKKINQKGLTVLSNIEEKSNAVFVAEIFQTNAQDSLNITSQEVVASAHSFWTN